MKYIVTEKANNDMLEIGEYISIDNKKAAQKQLKKIRDGFRRLSEMPEIGYNKPKWTDKNYKYWNIGKYLIVYEIQDNKTIIILRVLSCYRDISSLLDY